MTQEEKKSGKTRRILLFSAAGLGLLCCFPVSCITLIGGSSGSGNNESTSEWSVQAQEVTGNPSQASSAAPQQGSDTSDALQMTSGDDNAALVIGEVFTLGDYSYAINRWKTSTGLGNQFTMTRPVDGAVFILVEYDITNNTNQTQTALTGDLKLIDNKGREFRSSSKVETALSMLGNDNDFILSELQPGLKRTMQTGFEVPADAATGSLILVVPEKGLLSSGEARVRLDSVSRE